MTKQVKSCCQVLPTPPKGDVTSERSSASAERANPLRIGDMSFREDDSRTGVQRLKSGLCPVIAVPPRAPILWTGEGHSSSLSDQRYTGDDAELVERATALRDRRHPAEGAGQPQSSPPAPRHVLVPPGGARHRPAGARVRRCGSPTTRPQYPQFSNFVVEKWRISGWLDAPRCWRTGDAWDLLCQS